MRVRTRIAATMAACLLAATGPAVAAEQGSTDHRSLMAAQADLFSNGSFEEPPVPPGTFLNLPAGKSIGPWTVESGSVDLIGSGYWEAADGGQSVDLNGLGSGRISQTFATLPQQQYTLTYSLAGNPNGLPPVKTGTVSINGETVQTFVFDATGKTRSDMGYQTQTVNFTATSSATTLTFTSTTLGANGPVIDKVKICGCS
ncbi:choice-of-anchor C family protein [Streptomyces sp. NPDC018693]|uniref:choice-of-anchor C family protein n=1 Tax=unclassified Streptomyces TaxID=2593676 RepID=UPI0037B17A9F